MISFRIIDILDELLMASNSESINGLNLIIIMIRPMVQMRNNFPVNGERGERTFYNYISAIFQEDNDLICYYNPNLDEKYPDYILLSPRFGVILVEIKDYFEDALCCASKSGFWAYYSKKEKKEINITNPFDQMGLYRNKMSNCLNPLDLPCKINDMVTQIVILTQIDQMGPYGENIFNFAPCQIDLCFKNQFTRKSKFKQFLMEVLPTDLHLSHNQMKLIQGNIIPTARISSPQQQSLLKHFSAKDKITLLDREQEIISRNLGAGHRLVFGVAGSGKTVMLLARAKLLAIQNPSWKILILCYNRHLANYIKNSIVPEEYHAFFYIRTFHSWMREYIRNFSPEFNRKYINLEKKARRSGSMSEFFSKTVTELFLETQKLTQSPRKPIYDAILIDETQDFDKEWLKCILKVLNPKTNSLFITCDGLQGIYAQKRFRWIDVGIKATGRVKRLTKSYRNPIEIGQIAQKTLSPHLLSMVSEYDEFLPTKEFSGIHGQIEFIMGQSRTDEYSHLIQRIKRLRKTDPTNILILFHINWSKRNYNNPFFHMLKTEHLSWVEMDYFTEKRDQIFIGTFHGTKGLESDTVIIPQLDEFDSERARQLLYVGITRAKRTLILSAARKTSFTESLQINR